MIFAYYKSTNNSATITYYYYTSSINNINSVEYINIVFCCTVIYFNSQKAKTVNILVQMTIQIIINHRKILIQYS